MADNAGHTSREVKSKPFLRKRTFPNGEFKFNRGTLEPIQAPSIGFWVHKDAHVIARRIGHTVDWYAGKSKPPRWGLPLLMRPIDSQSFSDKRYMLTMYRTIAEERQLMFTRVSTTTPVLPLSGEQIKSPSYTTSVTFPAGTTFGQSGLDPAVATPAYIVCSLLQQIGEKLKAGSLRLVREGQTIADVEATEPSRDKLKGLIASFEEYVKKLNLLLHWPGDAAIPEKFKALDVCV